MKNTLTLKNRFGLSNRNNQYNYSEVANAFVGAGYTSQAGNTYFNALRLLDGVVIKEDVGQGYCRTFLNGLRIFDVKSKSLLCERSYNCCFYDKNFIQQEVVDLLSNFLIETAKKKHIRISYYNTYKQIKKIVAHSFSTDQREILSIQNQKYLK
ncbi:hypothetical protein LJC72_02535 [Bacteroides sp. OttesenSCG-928-D19]|nr:hypothetical protein [Bacteroides sp. OttesenSCG-928-D19]